MFMPMPIPMGGVGGGGAGVEEAGGVGAMGGAASEGPLPSTEYEEDEFAARAREGRSEEEEASMPPGPSADRGDDGLEGGGSDWYGGAAEREELLEDPWASEAPEEGGTWSWGDLFDQDGGGDGGGDGDGW